MNLSWLDGILPILRWAVNGTSKGTPLAVNLTGVGVTSTVADDTLTVNFEGSGGSGGNTTAEYLLSTADGTLPNSRVLTASSSVSVTNATGTATLACIMGTTSGTCCAGNDSRLSDARTPTAHATSHKHGGSDEIATATAAANAIPKAGVTGTLHVNWLPTGTSSATVCIGNDVRIPASNPSAGTAGQCVVSDGARVGYRGDVGRWWNSGITPGSTANDAHTLAVNNAPPSLRNGHPIRILDADGLVYNATTTAPKLVSSDQAITGLRGELFDHRGCLWFRVVVVSGTQCRIDIYNDEWCAAGNLVGHTGQFDTTSSTTVTLTVTADNGSGLGGTFKIDTRSSTATAATHSIQYFKTGIVQSVDNDNGELSFNGQAVSTATGAIKELWFGAPELVVAIHGQIVGPYAPETTNTALLNRNADSVRWQHGPATIVQCYAMHLVNDTGATQPKLIPMIDGTAVMVDGSAATMTASPIQTDLTAGATSTNLRVVAGSVIEFRTVAGTNGNARNAIFDIIAVLD